MSFRVLAVVSFVVLIWACIGLINPKLARFPNRASSVGVLVLAGMIFVGSTFVLVAFALVVVYFVFSFLSGGWL